MKKENEFSCLFGHNIISNDLYQAIKNNIVIKKSTEIVLFFHKNVTKLVFLWPNMDQKSIKVLIKTQKSYYAQSQSLSFIEYININYLLVGLSGVKIIEVLASIKIE